MDSAAGSESAVVRVSGWQVFLIDGSYERTELETCRFAPKLNKKKGREKKPTQKPHLI